MSEESSVVAYVRAGALAAGVTTFIVVWWQGLGRLGYVESTNELAWGIWVFSAIGVAIGATLGHRETWRSPIVRVLLAAVLGFGFGALLVGLSAFSAKVMHVGERNMPPVFLALAILLVVVGLRRIPERKGVRIALLGLFLVLAAMRVMAAMPTLVHRMEASLFPITPERARGIWDKKCGIACEVGRTIAVQHRVEYLVTGTFLVAKVGLQAEMETTKPFVQDGCVQLHRTPPTVPEWVKPFKTVDACFAAKPLHHEPFSITSFPPSYMGCCLAELTQRNIGDKFPSYYGEELVFHRMRWKGTEDRLESPLY